MLRDVSETQPIKDINALKKANKNIMKTVKDTEGILKAYQTLIDKGGGKELVQKLVFPDGTTFMLFKNMAREQKEHITNRVKSLAKKLRYFDRKTQRNYKSFVDENKYRKKTLEKIQKRDLIKFRTKEEIIKEKKILKQKNKVIGLKELSKQLELSKRARLKNITSKIDSIRKKSEDLKNIEIKKIGEYKNQKFNSSSFVDKRQLPKELQYNEINDFFKFNFKGIRGYDFTQIKRKTISNRKFGVEIIDDYSIDRQQSPIKRSKLVQKGSLILPAIGSISFRKLSPSQSFFMNTIAEKVEINNEDESSQKMSDNSINHRKRSSVDSFQEIDSPYKHFIIESQKQKQQTEEIESDKRQKYFSKFLDM